MRSGYITPLITNCCCMEQRLLLIKFLFTSCFCYMLSVHTSVFAINHRNWFRKILFLLRFLPTRVHTTRRTLLPEKLPQEHGGMQVNCSNKLQAEAFFRV
jgi:hypothetical protein